MSNGKGFTMIEMVMMIVILVILTVVAVPKIIDLRMESQAAALQGVVGAISSASAVNYAGRLANASKGVKTADLTCADAVEAILEGGVPDGYTVSGPATAAGILTEGADAGTNTCTVTQAGGSSDTVLIIGIN
jgi:MSHA pilin protein MshA